MVNICEGTLVHTNTRLILSNQQQISSGGGFLVQTEQLRYSSARPLVF